MKYIVFYSTEEDRELCLASSPAGINKSTYVAKLLRETGHHIEIISPSWSKQRRWSYHKGFDKTLDGSIVLHQLSTFSTPFRYLIPFQWCHSLLQLFIYLLFHTQAGEPVLVYHSYYLSLPILLARKFRKFKLILEVEEIYQDIVCLPKAIQLLENWCIRAADGYIFSTAAIRERINRDSVPFIVINGAYDCSEAPRMAKPSDGKIHCLYSGTFDSSKAGAYLAVEAAAFLPAQYCIHISGFGTEEQIRTLQAKIRQTQEKAASAIVYEGFLNDAAYQELLCKCQIGLNTQTPDQRFSDTCFPSKILVYLSHGMQVVSAANKAITTSDVGDHLIYYYTQEPESVAKAILSINLEYGADNIRFIQQLHENTRTKIQKLLSQV